jgi:hypothetical protein
MFSDFQQELESKLSFFTSESGVEITEIQQTLAYLRLKKSGALQEVSTGDAVKVFEISSRF